MTLRAHPEGKGPLFGARLFLFVCLTLLWSHPSLADFKSERTEVSLLADVRSVQPGKDFWALLQIRLQPGWHTYWVNPGDSGTVPGLTWTLPRGFSASDMLYQAPERLVTGPLVDYGYNEQADYLVKISAPATLWSNATVILMLKAQWLVCKDICVPEQADFSLALPVNNGAETQKSEEAALIDRLVAKLPQKLATQQGFYSQGDMAHLRIALPPPPANAVRNVLFFPITDTLVANAAPQSWKQSDNAIDIVQHKGDGPPPATARGVLSLFLKDGTRRDYEASFNAVPPPSAAALPNAPPTVPPPTAPKAIVSAPKSTVLSSTATARIPAVLPSSNPPAASASARIASSPPAPMPAPAHEAIGILSALWLAFLGGCVLNLMPCVFPILSLKALAIARKAHAEPRAVRLQGIGYTLGVVLSFLTLAAFLAAAQKAGKAAGWGYHMQSPAFVVSLAIVMFTVALNLSGFFEVPLFFGGIGGEAAGKDTALGAFFTGVLAVLVATPCTAPFMATAVGFALTQSSIVIFLVFAALGFGLAAPFLLLSLMPRLVRFLPRPGAWMASMREFLAFPLYATVIWLVWIVGQEAGADGVALALGALLVIVFAIWWSRRDMPLARLSAPLLAVAAVAASLSSVKMIQKQHLLPQTGAPETFSLARLEELREHGLGVFVDATADWCITCKVNERVALSSPDVREAFKRLHIVYMVADWTRGDSDITRYLGSFGRSGVPIYVYYPPMRRPARLLPQILTSSLVVRTLETP